MDDEALMTGSEIARRLGIPDWAFRRLVERGEVPWVELTKERWHKRTPRRYRLSEVARALGQPEPPFYKT